MSAPFNRDAFNGLAGFMWDRLPLAECEHNRIPALAEEWFVKDALAAGSPFQWRGNSPEKSHRLLYRYAVREGVKNAFRIGRYAARPEWLLLHQMTDLLEALLGKARDILEEQPA